MDANAMDAVYNQAILFFALFGTMFIVAFFITRKSANKFEHENPLEIRKAAAKKEKLVSTFLNVSTIKILGKDATLQELTRKLDRGAINTEEYKILEQTLKAS
ncbi:hypothetical protein SMGD1_2112 [Sulfurimonas gotlandica GD1]|jgi:hypothetical protein|uniref:SHOCT domain-containing protein n=1 Tax=Sulfurimonas gotlandica (strain DSM 19862 / JCM 16533 / GD1) TaxID=929558 RepID=B6BJB4_SULGG|nr:hypothetical protein [Sulfurimonas gotlandica]EDZ63668.1 hypothetical protein CBGD1_1288 [Sulfurimonas gotlandica GD1]EHP30635.1 hypothetical protein SMGD1_2112 [Sulfurimonas gotlandica GD1]